MLGSFITLAVVLLIVGFILAAGMVWLLATSLLCPPRMTDGKAAWVLKRLSPGDLGLAFEETSFEVRTPKTHELVRIAAWWMPHPQANGRCVVFLHGYADAKVGSIAWAPTWHALGWNILALDLRAHGESTGRYSTGGDFERHDVVQVIDQLRARQPSQTRQVALFGVSFGAAVAVATAAERDDIDAVVLDSPVPDFAEAAMLQMNLFGVPRGPLRRLAVDLAQRRSGATFRDARMLSLLPRLTCPALLIAPELDPLLEGAAGSELRAVLESRTAGEGRSEYWIVEDAAHLSALAEDPEAYSQRLVAFLEQIPAAATLRA